MLVEKIDLGDCKVQLDSSPQRVFPNGHVIIDNSCSACKSPHVAAYIMESSNLFGSDQSSISKTNLGFNKVHIYIL